MKVRRGDVILVDYLFSDRTGSKVRPCLVVQNDRNNQRLDDTIIALISSNTGRAIGEPTQLVIEVAAPAGRQSGLLFDSAVQCENLVTIDCQFVIRKIGSLPTTSMDQIGDCLKIAPGIT
ncbi:MAG: type II toxin-antitoxin system PemK/MazF family toxin [Planctomycetes bacterium]|nr:type II toxin-antitoxin system PemK/MazF family toxin [Planctomycetota bacterium]